MYNDNKKTFELIRNEIKRGATITNTCKKYGISTTTYYNWKRKYVTNESIEEKLLKSLEEENDKLKRIVVAQSLDIQSLKHILKN